VDDVIGNSEFDRAFRREIKAIYPDRALKELPADHPMFSFLSDTKTVRLSPLAAETMGARFHQSSKSSRSTAHCQ
jgi:hypothetical protein